ncbi:MAG: hypothetical protein K5880_14315 [Hydrogenophaga sp.]|uniref:hypothetical protein n=1 Tax=Hydrogenophaga sp. TaxID=1904254 RepID=UPI002621F8B0|nr:hypothetical protein [Hydrogenophaga sp.]MCV0439798.1 hypothetical protein [Hydrogenophaga sp.]
MSKIEPKEKYIIIHPKDDDGVEVKTSLVLTLGRQLGEVLGPDDTIEGRLIKALGTLDGIDNLQPNMGRYTIGMTIARTFDAEEVLTELKRRLEEDVLSDIIRPKLVT